MFPGGFQQHKYSWKLSNFTQDLLFIRIKKMDEVSELDDLKTSGSTIDN